MSDYRYTDAMGVVHHEHASGSGQGGLVDILFDVFWPRKKAQPQAQAQQLAEPWQGVKRLMTCPHCQTIGLHREQGDPQEEYARLMEKFKGPMQCGNCHGWSITVQELELETPRRGKPEKPYPQGLRVDCPPYRIPVQNTVDEEER